MSGQGAISSKNLKKKFKKKSRSFNIGYQAPRATDVLTVVSVREADLSDRIMANLAKWPTTKTMLSIL